MTNRAVYKLITKEPWSPSARQRNVSRVTTQCEAAKGIEAEFGTQKALAYMIGEKFINFLEAAEADAAFRREIPAFVSEIKRIFEPWQLAEYLEQARQTEPFDAEDYDDPEEAEMERQIELQRSTAELLLVERAKEWLLGE